MEYWLIFEVNGTKYWVWCNNSDEGYKKLMKQLEGHQMTFDEYEKYKANDFKDEIHCLGFDMELL